MPHRPQKLPPLRVLRNNFEYDPLTGDLTYKQPWGSRQVGAPVGTIQTTGALAVSLNYKLWLVHRICWKLHHGKDPAPHYVRHLNGEKADNRMANLKLVIHRTSMVMEQGPRSNNQSGYRGVVWVKQIRKYVTTRTEHGRTVYYGIYDTAEQAAIAYEEAVLNDPDHLRYK